MSNVRFYDPYDRINSGANDYAGRWVWTQDPFTPASDPDGNINEFDLVIEDPDDPSYVWDIYGGFNTPQPASVLTGGFTFDSASPTIFDWWGAWRLPKTTYTGFGYTFPYGGIYDGTWAGPFDVLDALAIHGASDLDWWRFPQSDTPVITNPVAGSTVDTTGGSVFVGLDWTTLDPQAQWEARAREVGGALLYTTGIITSAVQSASVVLPQTNVDVEIQLRYISSTGTSSWSDWASVVIHTTFSGPGPPSPPSTGSYFVGSTSGSIYPGGYPNSSGADIFTVDAHGTAVAGDRMFLFVYLVGNITVTPASGWSQVLHQTWTDGADATAYIFEHIYAGGDPASWDFNRGAMTDTKIAWVMGAYRGVGGVLASGDNETQYGSTFGSGGLIDTPSLTATEDCIEIAFLGNWSQTSRRTTDARRFDDSWFEDVHGLSDAAYAAGYHVGLLAGDASVFTIDGWNYAGPVIAANLLLSLRAGQGFILGHLTFN